MPCQIGDQHGLTHVEDIDLAALAHLPGLQHELRRLRDRHEIALDLRVRDGDRAAARNLLAKARHHAPGRAQHVAEADDDQLGAVGGLQRLASELGQPLRRAHDVGRIHRLVGRDQHDLGRAVRLRSTGYGNSREHIVAHCLERVFILHQRHVLVSRGVKHDVGPIAREQLAHARLVFRIADDRTHGERRTTIRELLRDRIEGKLGELEKHQTRRREAGNLPAKLRADRAAGAGDEHGASIKEAMQPGFVERDGITAEQIVELDRSQRGHADAAGNDVGERGHRHHADAGLAAELDRTLALAVARFGHGNDGVRDAMTLGDQPDLTHWAEDRHAGELGTMLGGIIVE